MAAVACAMEDDGQQSLDQQYGQHQTRCDLEGMEALSEFEWINRFVIRLPKSKIN